jgi:hypothetical protein
MITLSTDGGLFAAGARQFLASVSRPASVTDLPHLLPVK